MPSRMMMMMMIPNSSTPFPRTCALHEGAKTSRNVAGASCTRSVDMQHGRGVSQTSWCDTRRSLACFQSTGTLLNWLEGLGQRVA